MIDSRITIAIPTYRREEILIATIRGLLNLESCVSEILVVDQSEQHAPETIDCLDGWNAKGDIRWIRQSRPSITQAMNLALVESRSDLVLFLDDDIVPSNQLVSSHREEHGALRDIWATVGQVIQPWQSPETIVAPRRLKGLRKDFDFPFHSTIDHDVTNVMAGNLCVHRERALSIGGFDENFQGSAFRFETEFARRVIHAGGKIRFVGSAGIHHLRVPSGGTRKDGSHLTSADPRHGIGDHYYAFLHGKPREAWGYSLARVFREVRTKFHLTHPWWIPVKMFGELRAMWGGWRMARRKRGE